MLLSSSTRINLILLLLCLLFSVFYISLIPCQRLLQKRHGNREIGANGRVIVMVTIGWWLSLAFSLISRSSLHRALFVISQSCPIGTWMFYIRSSWRLQSWHNWLTDVRPEYLEQRICILYIGNGVDPLVFDSMTIQNNIISIRNQHAHTSNRMRNNDRCHAWYSSYWAHVFLRIGVTNNNNNKE